MWPVFYRLMDKYKMSVLDYSNSLRVFLGGTIVVFLSIFITWMENHKSTKDVNFFSHTYSNETTNH